MSDAANLLSILRGELPVPPLNPSSPPAPPPQASSSSSHFDSLLDRFNSPPSTSTNTRLSPVSSSVVRPSIQSRSNSNSLLALLQGGGGNGVTTTTTNTREEIVNKEKEKDQVKAVPNFNFVSPFQLLSSAAAAASTASSSSNNNLTTTTKSASPSPSQVSSPSFTPKQQQPSTDSSNPKTLNFPTTTQVPPPPPPTERVLLPSDSKPLPLPLPLPLPHQLISIPPPKTTHHNLESDNPLFKEEVSSPESITPISLFTPNLRPSSSRGGYRKIGISKTSLSWIVQPQPQPQPQFSTSSKKNKRSKVSSSSSGSVRVIDRDSGGRVLIEKPFSSSNRGTHSEEEGEEEEVVHLEFSKQVILQENEEKRGLLMLGSKGSLSIWLGNDQFQDRKGKDSMYKPRLILKANNPETKNDYKISLAKLHPNFPTTPLVAIAITATENRIALVNVDQLVSREGEEVGVEVLAEQAGGHFSSDTEILDFSFSPDGSLLAYVSSTSLTILKVSSSSKPPCLESRMVLPSSIVSPPHEISFIPSTTSTSSNSSDTTTTKGVSVNKGVVISSENGTKIDLFQFKPYSTTLELEQEPSITIELDSSTSTERGEEGGEEARGFSDFSNLEFNPKTSTLLIGGSSLSSRGSLFSFRLDFSSPKEGGMMMMKVSKVLETRIETRLLQFVLDPSTTSEGEGEDGVLVLHSEGIQHLVLKQKKEEEEELLPIPPPPSEEIVNSSSPLPENSTTTLDRSAVAPPLLTNPFSSTSQSPIVNNLSLEGKEEETGEASTSPPDPDTDSGRRMSLENTIHVSEETLTREERVDETSWEYMRRASIPINSNQDTRVSNDNQREKDEEGEEEENRKRDREVEEVLKSRRERERESEREKEEEKLDRVQILQVEQVQKEDKDKEIKLSGALVNKAIKNMKAKTAAALNKDGNNSQGFSNTYKNYSFSIPTTSSTTSTIPPLQAQAKELDSTTRTTTNESQPLDLPQSPTTPIAFFSPPPPSQEEAQQGARVGERLNRFEQDLPKTVESILTSQFEKYFNDNNKSLNRSESKASPVTSLDIPNLLKQVSQTTSQSIEQSLTRGLGLLEIQKVVSREIETKLEFTIGKILPREISSVLLDPDFLRSISSSLIPIIQDQVTRLILTGLVPSFKHTLNKSIDEILKEMKSEMVGVRKEIVKEQSSTVRELELEVKGLKSQVGELKGMLERMEKLLIANSNNNNNNNNSTPQTTAVVAPTAPSFSSPSSNALSPATSTTHRSISVSSSVSQPENPQEPLPPIPRSETPLSFSYEDHLTTLLQPSESPLFPSLVQFLNNSSPTTSSRLDKIFPPSTGESSSRISMAVTLSLAFRLSELIKSKNEITTTGLGSDEKIWLEWLKRAIGATCKDQQSPEFEAMIPKILEMVLNNLVARGRSLMSSRDFVGAGEIRLVEQYVRARLSMFNQ